MRWIGIIGIVAALAAVSAAAADEERPCPGLLEERGAATAPPAQDRHPTLTDNQCESLKTRELRVPLLEIPQEGEDPMALSLGARNGGGTLRFRIPFSF